MRSLTAPHVFLLFILVIQLSSLLASEENSWGQNDNGHSMPKITHLEVKCGKKYMSVRMSFSGYFNGIVYSKGGYSKERCAYVHPNSGLKEVKFDVHYDSCGTNSDLHGKYFENTLIIQYQQDIIEAWDEARKIKCEWHDYYEKAAVNPSIKVADLEVVQQDFMGDKIGCWLEIQAGKGPWAKQVSGMVKIGQHMTMVVAITDEYSQFDMRVKSCFAHDGSRYRKPLYLTDESGCVLRPKLMSPFKKVKVDEGRATVISYAYFSAFKFPDKVDVQMECKVEVCRYGCPDHCQKDGYGKKKQSSDGYGEENQDHYQQTVQVNYPPQPEYIDNTIEGGYEHAQASIQSDQINHFSGDQNVLGEQADVGAKIQFEADGPVHDLDQVVHQNDVPADGLLQYEAQQHEPVSEHQVVDAQDHFPPEIALPQNIEHAYDQVQDQEIVHEQQHVPEYVQEQVQVIPEAHNEQYQDNRPNIQHEPPKLLRPQQEPRPHHRPEHNGNRRPGPPRPNGDRPVPPHIRDRRPPNGPNVPPHVRFPHGKPPRPHQRPGPPFRPHPDDRNRRPNHRPNNDQRRPPPPNRHPNRENGPFDQNPRFSEQNRHRQPHNFDHRLRDPAKDAAENIQHDVKIPIPFPEPSDGYSQSAPLIENLPNPAELVHQLTAANNKHEQFVQPLQLPEQPPAHYEQLPREPNRPHAENRRDHRIAPARGSNSRTKDFPKGPRFIHRRSVDAENDSSQTVLGVTKSFQVISDNDIVDDYSEMGAILPEMHRQHVDNNDICMTFTGFITGTAFLLLLIIISVITTAVLYHKLPVSTVRPFARKDRSQNQRVPMQRYPVRSYPNRAV